MFLFPSAKHKWLNQVYTRTRLRKATDAGQYCVHYRSALATHQNKRRTTVGENLCRPKQTLCELYKLSNTAHTLLQPGALDDVTSARIKRNQARKFIQLQSVKETRKIKNRNKKHCVTSSSRHKPLGTAACLQWLQSHSSVRLQYVKRFRSTSKNGLQQQLLLFHTSTYLLY